MSAALTAISPIFGLSQMSNNRNKSNPMQGGAPEGYNRFSTLNPQQSELLQRVFGSLFGQGQNQGQNQGQGQGQGFNSGLGYLQKLSQGGEGAFKEFEAPYLRQFNEQTIPKLAERFAGLGATSSSGFQQALGQAGAGLSENLAQLHSQLQMGAGNQLFQSLMSLLGLETQGLVPKEKSFWENLATSGAQGLGQAVGMLPFLL